MGFNEIFKDSGDCQGPKLIIFWVINLIGFLLLGITGIIVAAQYSNHSYDWIATYYYYYINYEPFTVDEVIMYILVSIIIIFSICCFIFILLKGVAFKDQEFYNKFSINGINLCLFQF